MKYCPQCRKILIGKECECGFKVFDNKTRKTETETKIGTKQTEEARKAEEKYYKPLSVKERRIRRKEGIKHLKKLVNDLPRVFRNTHLWKKYGEINHE